MTEKEKGCRHGYVAHTCTECSNERAMSYYRNRVEELEAKLKDAYSKLHKYQHIPSSKIPWTRVSVFYKNRAMTVQEAVRLSGTTVSLYTVVERIQRGMPIAEAVKSKEACELAGGRFGRLTVLKSQPLRKGGHRNWLCRCDCGVEKTVRGTNLKQGKSLSCGCLKKEVQSEAAKQRNKRLGWGKKIEKSNNRTRAIRAAGMSTATYYSDLARAGKAPKQKMLSKKARSK